jgi:two-component system sensor histidine kinase RegB
VTLDLYLQQFLDDWLLTHADTPAEISLNGTQPAPQIIADHTVTQSITNVLNNAAEASFDQTEIRIEACWDKDNLSIKIHDQGNGLPAEISDNLGVEPFVSTKPPGKGLGLGLYLAKNNLDRLGGSITLESRSTQSDNGATSGVTAEITLPLHVLKTHD